MRHYKLGEEPHDERAWQGGNIGPDVDVPEPPPSSIGSQLYYAKVCAKRCQSILKDLDLLIPQQTTPGQLTRVSKLMGEYLDATNAAINKAIWHHEHDRLSDIGAQIIE